jgi:iron complex transport system ATP-binding protein
MNKSRNEPAEMSLLAAHNIGVAIAGREILAEINFALHSGEIVGLIGPNGAGKTTLLRVLARLLEADSGTVALDNKALTAYAPTELAQRCAYLAQGAPAHWPLRVDQVVALGRLPHLAWWQRPTARDQQIVDAAMRLADVEYLRERLVTTLSGGERTRVLLARIFAAQPQLILADEPVAALDPYHQLHVMELLREHAHRVDSGEQRARGAVLTVLHDLNLAARFCDRIVLLAHGRIVCTGSAREVLTPENLRDVYGVSARINDANGEFSVTPWQRVR